VTKAQALALMIALETAKVSASAVMTFASGGSETWTVQLDPTTTYSGAQLAALSAYCSANGLSLTAIFSQLGVI